MCAVEAILRGLWVSLRRQPLPAELVELANVVPPAPEAGWVEWQERRLRQFHFLHRALGSLTAGPEDET